MSFSVTRRKFDRWPILLLLALPLPVAAATVTTAVVGSMGTNGNSCLQLLTIAVGGGENCMYDGGPTSPNVPNPSGEIIGPMSQIDYYDENATPGSFSVNFTPTHASGQIRQRIDGTISVDDAGTADPADDLLSFDLTLTSPLGGPIVRHLGSSVVDRYTSMNQVLAPRTADSVMPNAFGGFDYVIGSEGFPTLLTFNSPTEPQLAPCNGQPFGSMDCPASFDLAIFEPDRWTGTSAAGLGSLEGNYGARTVGTVTDFACTDTGNNNDCHDSKVSFSPLLNPPNQAPGGGVTAEDVGWDQLLLKVSTDAGGQVVAFAGFNVQEFQVFGANFPCGSDPGATIDCNSWNSSYFDGTGIVANDDGPINSPAGSPVTIDVLANDTNFQDPVTVTITTPPAQGTAIVNGSPGNQANIDVTYTADPAASGSDSFVYTIDDGTNSDSATVSLTIDVIPLTPVASDGAITIETSRPNGAPGSSPAGLSGSFTAPGAGGSLGNLPATVSISSQGARGNATVSGVDISYTITDPAFFAGTDSFVYTITDDDGEMDSGTVTITVPDAQPSISVWSIAADQDRASPAFAVGQFISYGNGAPADHAISVSAQASNGTCTVSPADATGSLVYVPDAGFTGTDSCDVTVSDGDGDSATSTVDITVAPTSEVQPDIGGAGGAGPLFILLLALVAGLRRRCRWRHLRVSGLAFAAVVLAAPAAGAQALEEVVVTARKVEENLKEVPLAITAFDSKTIEEAGITNLYDVAEMTPGLSFFNAFGENLPVPVIRGVAPTDIFGENNAAIFVDGVYISGREGLNFSQLDLERIEIVKGPQSALYGRTAFSGAINYVTKLPSEEFESKLTIEAGNRGKKKGSIMFTGPLLGQSFRGRISALYDEWDGSYDAAGADIDIGGYRYRSLQGSLLWLPSDALELRFSYYKSNDDIDDPAAVSLPSNCEDRVEPPPNTPDHPINPGTRFQNFCGEIPDIEDIPGLSGGDAIPKVEQATGENRELDRANLSIEWDLGGIGVISALTGYSKTEQNSVSDFARSLGHRQPFLYCSPATLEAAQVPNSCTDPGGQPVPADQMFFSGVYDRELGGETEELSQELRFTSPQDRRLRYTGGIYWYNVESKGYPGNPIATRPLPSSPSPTTGIGLPPFDVTAPNFAIGTAIFYSTFADDPFQPGFNPDGGIDPLGRVVFEEETEGWAVFSGVDFDLTDRLTARGELRWSQESKDERTNNYAECEQVGYVVQDMGGQDIPNPCGDDIYDLRVTNALPTCIDGQPPTNDDGDFLCSPEGSATFRFWTGRAGLDYQANDEWMIYGSVAFGEKPGGLQLIAADLARGGSILLKNVFKPEKITAYELGAKGYLFDRRISIDASVFYNDWRDIVLRQLQESVPGSGEPFEQPEALNVNAGDASVWGAEISGAFSISENLTGTANAAWTSAELDQARMDTYARFPSFRADCGPVPSDPQARKQWWENCNAISGDVSGNNLLRQPEWTLSASLTYRRPFRGDWEWFLRGDASYQSDVYVGNDNETWLPAHTYVNAKLGAMSGRFQLELWVRNLLNDNSAIAAFRDIYWANSDQLYPPYSSLGPRPNFDKFVPLRNSVTYGRERTYGITFKVFFGVAAQ